MAKVKVLASHWPSFNDWEVGFMTFNVWTKSLTTLRHNVEGQHVKNNLHLLSQKTLKEYINAKDAIVGGLGLGYYYESSSDCECEGLNETTCILRDIMHHDDDNW
jgi:hypothetical protein